MAANASRRRDISSSASGWSTGRRTLDRMLVTAPIRQAASAIWLQFDGSASAPKYIQFSKNFKQLIRSRRLQDSSEPNDTNSDMTPLSTSLRGFPSAELSVKENLWPKSRRIPSSWTSFSEDGAIPGECSRILHHPNRS